MPNTALGDESGNDSPPVNGGKVLVGSYNVGTSGVPPDRTNWPVFLASAAGILAVTLWAFIGRESAEKALGSITTWIATNFGWFYILTATVVIVFILGWPSRVPGRSD